MRAGATLEFRARDLLAARDADTEESELVLAVYAPPKHGRLALLDVPVAALASATATATDTATAPESASSSSSASSASGSDSSSASSGAAVGAPTRERERPSAPLSRVRAAPVWLRCALELLTGQRGEQ